MKFSEAWLREWVNPALSTEELGHRLTMAGLELDNISPATPAFREVVVGHVISVAPHPHADRLTLCQVDAGGDEHLPVVCGAENVTEGMYAPFARVGAVLPGGLEIKKAKLRGIESFGMLCSAMELGLTESADGLMRLDDNAQPGEDIRDYLRLDDAVFEIDLTPNRADCLSIAGIAREVSALTGAPLTALTEKQTVEVGTQHFGVEITSPKACPRYAGRVINTIDASVVTPWWMQERLRRCGIRSIGPVVDVTNYVMLELGQPMHAFDLAKLKGGIRVRPARQGEMIRLLDGQTLTLDDDTLLITDHQRSLAMAGIMGGLDSGVTNATQTIFLESAFFSPEIVAGKARKYGLHTESSHRFERGVDPALQVRALERATTLLLEIVGGEPGPIVDLVNHDHLPHRSSITLRFSRVNRLLGISPEYSTVGRILTSLGCKVSENEDGWRVTPPSFRFDLAIESDLVEEVARIVGYDQIPETSQDYKPIIRQRDEAERSTARIRELLIDRGYLETITFSFVDPAWEEHFSPGTKAKRLANPISAEMAVMRTTLWSGLVKTALHNLNRQQTRLKLFEIGLRFIESESGLEQTPMLGCLVTGDVLPQQWGVRARAADFFDVKGDVEALLAFVGLLDYVEFKPVPHPTLHPGQSAALLKEGEICGWLGALHPSLERTLGLGQRVYLFEIELAILSRGRVASFKPLSRFPAIRRDIAIVVGEAISAAQVKHCITSEQIEALQECQVFDVYRGRGVTSGQKSLALGLILQDFSRTLTDAEVDDLVARIVSKLERDLGASLRE